MRTLETPAFVYFDLGKVLLEFSHEVMCQQMAEVAGIDHVRVREIVFDSGLSDQYECGQIDSDEFCQRFQKQAGSDCDPTMLLRAGSDIFQLKSEMLPLVGNLAVSGIPIGILSNTCAAHWEWVFDRYFFLEQFFQTIVLSYEVGAMKPDRKIYEAAIDQAAVEPGRIFFVDDRAENVQGAIDAGIDAHLFESVSQVQKLLLSRGVSFNY